LADVLPHEVLWHGGKWNANKYFAQRLVVQENERVKDIILAIRATSSDT
jgi:hypothetical protein